MVRPRRPWLSRGELSTVTVELAELTFPATLRWTGGEWRRDDGDAETVVTIDWKGAGGFETRAPFADRPELERQLEALGYLD